MSRFLSSFLFCGIRPVSDVELVKIFSYCEVCQFVLLVVSFALHKLFTFMRSSLLIVSLSTCTIGILFRKLYPMSILSKQLSTFSSIRISVSWSGSLTRSLIHYFRLWRMIFMGLLHSSTCQHLLDQHHLVKPTSWSSLTIFISSTLCFSLSLSNLIFKMYPSSLGSPQLKDTCIVCGWDFSVMAAICY